MILSPVFSENVMFMENRGETSSATYVFKISVDNMPSSALWNDFLLSFNFSMLSVNYRREPIYLSDDALQNEAMQHFHRCHKCHMWVCDSCWNDEVGLCAECAPRVNVEIAAARADKMKRDIWDKADQTQVFKGEIEQKTTFCPNCGKPAGQSKFCTNCGANLALNLCPNCGAENDQSVRFCGECGTKLK